jgi:hypothetical protein
MFLIVKNKIFSENDGWGGTIESTAKETVECLTEEELHKELAKADFYDEKYSVYEATRLKVKKTISFQVEE